MDLKGTLHLGVTQVDSQTRKVYVQRIARERENLASLRDSSSGCICGRYMFGRPKSLIAFH
jgi:hypothetical protein